jgi:carboxymethylenebutenolidase
MDSMTDAMRAETIAIDGHGGDSIEAYLAQPVDRGSVGSVVVIHHMPGYDEATKEIVRRFAHYGYLALCPNLYHREAPGASSDDAAATARAQGGVPDDRFLGDVAGAATHLRSLPQSNGKVATIGYCSGGRQSFLAACSLSLDAAVDCYGAFVVRTPPEGAPASFKPLAHLAKDLSCPLLGLFGKEDTFPSPDETAELDKILTDLGKPHEFHTYENAGHAFFSTDRPSYRPEAATAGWGEIWKFFGEYLAS